MKNDIYYCLGKKVKCAVLYLDVVIGREVSGDGNSFGGCLLYFFLRGFFGVFRR